MEAMSSSLNSKHLNNRMSEQCEPVRRELKNISKKIKLLVITLVSILLLVSCDSKISKINIHGTYKGTGIMNYEAVVEDGTITIYSTSFFEKEVYWYGTCHADDLDENNILVSKKLERERNRSWFGFGSGMNESYASEKKIKFTEDSLTFVYDFSGMSVSEVTLYKETTKRPKNNSNADELPETETYPYIAPVPETKESEKESDIAVPSGDVYSL